LQTRHRRRPSLDPSAPNLLSVADPRDRLAEQAMRRRLIASPLVARLFQKEADRRRHAVWGDGGIGVRLPPNTGAAGAEKQPQHKPKKWQEQHEHAPYGFAHRAFVALDRVKNRPQGQDQGDHEP
jgi:hypothetical protein